MHIATQLVLFWAAAFLTLAAALALLNAYYGLIGNDLTLRSVGQEAAIAAVASLVEGASAWVVVTVLPAASRALIIPALIVALIYKLSHLEDWSRYDIVLCLLFQIVISYTVAMLCFAHVQAALVLLGLFAGFLAILAGVVRSL